MKGAVNLSIIDEFLMRFLLVCAVVILDRIGTYAMQLSARMSRSKRVVSTQPHRSHLSGSANALDNYFSHNEADPRRGTGIGRSLRHDSV